MYVVWMDADIVSKYLVWKFNTTGVSHPLRLSLEESADPDRRYDHDMERIVWWFA